MDDRCRLRRARRGDAAALAALERRCFSDPWSAQSFREALATDRTEALVAEDDDAVLGYLIGHEAGGAAEILNLAVAPEARRRGIARRLIEAGLARLVARGAEEVFLEVRESNLAARSLYAAYGFRPVGIRHGYYRAPREDALVLRLEVAAEKR